tara:strand:+ start:15587 stop:16360 length:774 start_codon:yes stop_codon:yes gene_type:complete
VSEVLLELPSDAIAKLKDGLRMGLLASPYTLAQLRSTVGAEYAQPALDGLGRLAAGGIEGPGVVTWMESVEKARQEVPRPSLVWTGPDVPGLHARDTRQVFEELIGRAEKSLWISTYAYFEGKEAFAVLASRMEQVPELEVHVLLNIKWRKGNATDIVSKAAFALWKYNWPGTRRPRVFYFPESLVEDPANRAVLHAKAIVRDGQETLVTSANFTEAALDRNIELGVLFNDAHFARRVVRHYQRLIEEGRLLSLPSS